MRPVRFPLLLLTLAAFLAACAPKVPAMTPEETQQINELAANMTTRCVGRYLIDLPAGMTPPPGPFGTKVEEVSIAITPINKSMFELALKKREAELKNTLMLPDKYPWLQKTYPLPNSDIGIVFDRAESHAESRFIRTLELWAWKEGYQIHAEISARDTSFPEHQDDQYVARQKTDTPKKLAHLLSIYERVRGRADNVIPTEPGFCFAYGFVAGKPGQPEEMGILYALKNVPDVTFAFNYDAPFQEDSSLLERGKAVKSMLESSKGRSLRKGKEQAGGIPYEEWLMAGNIEKNFRGEMFTILGNMFTLESSNKTGNENTPYFVADMQNGYYWEDDDLDKPRPKPTQSTLRATLSEAQAVYFWDRVIPTLRLRPGAF